ncbi:hypothetical protein [Halarchaeum nitratireducens]|uniref:Uncharacterized protein n=1 Tax=Halarchaeum nitratireducens TaxID=489913 RepID=A0A830GEG3_9EURY|nr:hypothetical protein [Halarchaeum nitratireducens]GGN25361.1 hypothetical protein GCM10009021_29170 [Halarchaeum nitratireducens]
MTCPPKRADLARTVINATAVDESNGWWTGLVRDRVHDTGEVRLRLERYPPNNSKNRPEHTWRVRPEYWDSERDAVEMFEQYGGETPTGVLPIDDFYTVKEHLPIRKEPTRRVSLVRLEKNWGQTVTRLYHWDPRDGATKQKWTIGRNWDHLSTLATRKLANAQ